MRILFDNGAAKADTKCFSQHRQKYSVSAEPLGAENLAGYSRQLAMAARRLYLDRIAAAVNACTPGSYAEVDIPFK